MPADGILRGLGQHEDRAAVLRHHQRHVVQAEARGGAAVVGAQIGGTGEAECCVLQDKVL